MTTSLPAIPSTPFNFAHHLISLNENRKDKPAYIDDHNTLTYGALSNAIQQFAAALIENDIRREERLLILMHDNNDWPVAFLGALYASVVPVAANTLLTADDYKYMIDDCRPTVAIVSDAIRPVFEQAHQQADHTINTIVISKPTTSLPDSLQSIDQFLNTKDTQNNPARTHPDEPAFWLYSSGSTGNPKGTIHTHANLYWTAELYGKEILKITEQDICYSAAKLFFAYGLGNALSFPLSVGATVILMAGRPTPDAVFKCWQDHQPTIFFGAPTGYAGMLADPNLPTKESVSLRLASSAGEALPAELGKRFATHYGADIIDGIGSTEMLHIFLSNTPDNVRYGTTGWPVPGYDIELRDDDGNQIKDGEIGDLYIRGPSAALMYWNNREKTRETFQGEWTKSGDKYIRNEDGSYTYSGRSDDMLKVSGVYVSPFEVEATLIQHKAVLEVAVVGDIDADGLTKTKAYVVLKDGQSTDSDTLKQFVKSKLAPFKYPRIIEFVDALPKTATGKIQRFKLRQANT